MKVVSVCLYLCYCVVFLLQPKSSYSQSLSYSKFCDQIALLNKIIDTNHYQPKSLDDSLSNHIHTSFLNKLNENNWFFLEEDMHLINQDKFLLDDYIKAKDCEFLNTYVRLYAERIQQVRSYLVTLREESFTFDGKDTIYFGERTNKFHKNKKVLFEVWNKKIKFRTAKEAIEKYPSLLENPSHFKRFEDSLKRKVIDKQICALDELLFQEGGLKRELEESFLSAFASCQDPNTNFFNNADLDYFYDSLATSQLSFGIYTTKNDDGEIQIIYIAPGSAASIEGSLEEEDIIQSMYSISQQGLLETYCISNEDVALFLHDSQNKKIRFQIKKKNGSIKYVELTKSTIKSPENLTRGYLIEGSSLIGYIPVPSFYTNQESPNGMGLTSDMAKEVYRLQKHPVEGLIIDLRFNGGGSIREAISLTGMFIDTGPVSIFQDKERNLTTYKDENRGILFDKPLIVLVNEFSASASEFFSAALQDYNRAIIVGNSSYGKASSQVVLPLDENNEDLGFCKVTVERFYRPSGTSVQSRGVIPDIELPSIYDGLNITENYEAFAFQNDSIIPEEQFTALQPISLTSILQKSNDRVKQNESLQKIVSTNKALKEKHFIEEQNFPLTLERTFSEVTSYNQIWVDFENYFENKKTQLKIRNTFYVNDLLILQEDEREHNEIVIKALEEDIYLEEAYNIMLDYIKPNKN